VAVTAGSRGKLRHLPLAHSTRVTLGTGSTTSTPTHPLSSFLLPSLIVECISRAVQPAPNLDQNSS
jgi:hypothetical protein